MTELWSRSVASVYDGKVEGFKRLAGDLVSTIRENDSETLNYAIFLDEPARVAVIVEQYASSADWLAHTANLDRLTPHFPDVCEFTEIEFSATRRSRRSRRSRAPRPDCARRSRFQR